MYRVRTVTTGVAGTPWYTNMYFEGTAIAGAADAVTAVGNFWGSFNEMVATGLSMTVEDDVAVIDPVTGDITTVHGTGSGSTTPGTNSSAMLPAATTLLIRLRTGIYEGGRQIQGRLNFGGMVEDESDFGLPSTDVKFKLQSDVDTYLRTNDVELGVWSRKNGRFDTVQSASVWGNWAVLRSHRD